MKICPHCGRENPEEQKYCLQCTKILDTSCPECQFPLSYPYKVCQNCGATLSSALADDKHSPKAHISSGLSAFIPPTLVDKIKAATASSLGQRRIVSVLVLEKSYSDDFHHEINEETAYLLDSELTQVYAEVVYEFEGHIDYISGRGMTALFGAPVMYENHAERAILAALKLQKRLQSLQPTSLRKYGFFPDIHMGINTGPVIIGKVGSATHMDYTVIGDTVNLASELAQSESPGNILVSESTHQLSNPIFHFESVVLPAKSGREDALTVFRPIGMRKKPGNVRGLPGMQVPMIGREEAIIKLKNTLNDVNSQGKEKILFLSGDAGVGKSRLILEFKKSIASSEFGQNIAIYEGHCQAHTHARPYWVIANMLRKMANIDENQPPERQLDHLTIFLENLKLNQKTVRPILVHLLGINSTSQETGLQIQLYQADMLQKLIHNALRQLFLALGRIGTTVLIFEDLHWCDSASWDFLVYLAKSTETSPLLLILVSREIHSEKLTKSSAPITWLNLKALSPQQSRMLAHQLINQTSPEAEALVGRITERAAGNPFYMEEIIRMLIDAGGIVNADGDWQVTAKAESLLLKVPETLQALIMARIDSLDPDYQYTLQKAAVLGMSFSIKLLQALGEESRETIIGQLKQLVFRQFLTAASSSDEENIYTFQHVLTQDAIYSTLLKRQRQRLHGQVAEELETNPTLFPTERDQLLAFHYMLSPNPKQAIPYLLTIADNAHQHFANETAVQNYQQALILIESHFENLNENYFRAKIGLGQTLKFLGQYDKANKILSEALQALLRWSMQEKPVSLLKVMVNGLREIADIQMRKAKFESAISFLEAGLEAMGENGAESHPLMYRTLMERIVFVLFRQGKLDEAFDLAQSIIANVVPDSAPDPVTLANVYNTLGGISWQQGNLQSAINFVEQSLKLYEKLNYTWGTAHVYSNLGILTGQKGDWSQAITYWERALNLRQEIGDIQNQAFNLMNLGQLRLLMGDFSKAQQDLELALSILHKLDDSFGIARANAILAQNALTQKQIELADKHVQVALEMADEVGGHEVQIEARWIKSLVLAEQGELLNGIETAANALEMAKNAGLMDAESDCLRTLGTLNHQMGNHVVAETYLRESIELSRQLDDPFRQALALLEMGRLYLTLVKSSKEKSVDWRNSSQSTLLNAIEMFITLGAEHYRRQAENELQKLEEIPSSTRQPEKDSGAKSATVLPFGEWHNAAILWVDLELPPDTDEEIAFETFTFILPACATIAQEYGGRIQRRPDGLMVVFGAPTAYEDDTERAVQTAYHILEYVQKPNIQNEFPLTVKIAINQGPVIAGQAAEGLQTEIVVRGEPLDQVRQAAAAVPPDQIWVTETVRVATERLFTYYLNPLLDIIKQPLWQLAELRAKPAQARGLPGVQTRFIGRDATLKAMLDLTTNLEQELGGIIWIEGEAGIGKSRLMREFKTAVPLTNCLIWAGGCSPQRANHAFSLFSDLLTPVFDFQPADSGDQIRRKIDEVVQTWPQDAQVTQPYLEILAGIRPIGIAGERLNRLEPEQLRQQIFVAIRRLLKTIAREQPLIILLDDLHWIDPVSAELLIFIATIVVSSPILFVCAQRREGSDSPNDRLMRMHSLLPGQTLRFMLERLHPELSLMLLDDLLPGADLPKDLRQMIVSRSEGNPYFIEEFVRMFIEQGYVKKVDEEWQLVSDLEFDASTIPSSLETLIRSRVDALPEELKKTLQHAAIIGQEFEIDLLETITNNPNIILSLERLASRLMIHSIPDTNRWKFSHTLYESIVYKSMLKVHRKMLHHHLAQALEKRWSDSKSEHAKDLAYHYLQADEKVKALPYLIQAGEWAAGQHAAEEALTHFKKASELLEQIPDHNEEWQWRIALGLGDVYCFIGQYAESLEALEAVVALSKTTRINRTGRSDLYRRMGETARKHGDYDLALDHFLKAQKILGKPENEKQELEMARILNGLSWVYFSQGDFKKAGEAGKQSLTYAETADGLNELARAHNLLGGVHWQVGEWREAFHHTTRAMVLREQMGYSWGVAATLSNLGILAFFAGHWHKAISFFERSLAMRKELGDVEGITLLQNNLANAYRQQGKLEEAEQIYKESVKTAETYNISYHIANSSVGLAHVILGQNRIEEAEEIIENGLNLANTIGAQDILAEAYRVQAEVLLAQFEPEKALEIGQKGASMAATVGNRSHEAAAWRIASKAALEKNDYDLAKTLIKKAEKTLLEAMDDLETGHVAAQAYRIYHKMGKVDVAEEKLRNAREIFNRLGISYFLNQLDEEVATAGV